MGHVWACQAHPLTMPESAAPLAAHSDWPCDANLTGLWPDTIIRLFLGNLQVLASTDDEAARGASIRRGGLGLVDGLESSSSPLEGYTFAGYSPGRHRFFAARHRLPCTIHSTVQQACGQPMCTRGCTRLWYADQASLAAGQARPSALWSKERTSGPGQT
jgi:hypothetical protein